MPPPAPPGGSPTSDDELLLLEESARSFARRLAEFVGYVLAGVVLFVILIVTLAVMIAAVVGLVFLIVRADPGTVQPRADAGYLDVILINRWVIWALRVLVFALGITGLFVALYVCASVAHRTRHGHYLRSAGGFHADTAEKADRDLTAVEPLFELLDEAQQEKDQLAERLTETTNALERIREQRDELADLLLEITGDNRTEEEEDEGRRR